MKSGLLMISLSNIVGDAWSVGERRYHSCICVVTAFKDFEWPVVAPEQIPGCNIARSATTTAVMMIAVAMIAGQSYMNGRPERVSQDIK